jgi:hypothetical protein
MTSVRTNAADAPRATLEATVWPAGDVFVDVPVVLDMAISAPLGSHGPPQLGPVCGWRIGH